MMPKFAPIKEELEENDYCFANISTEEVYICCYLETRSRSKVSGAYESERDNVKTYILVASFGLIHLL